MIPRPWVPLPAGASLAQVVDSLNTRFAGSEGLWRRAIAYPTRKTVVSAAPDGSDHTILADATAGPVTVTLPIAAQFFGGRYNVVKVDATANAVTIAAAGGDNIDGAATVVLSQQWASLNFQSDGATRWVILSRLPASLIVGFSLAGALVNDTLRFDGTNWVVNDAFRADAGGTVYATASPQVGYSFVSHVTSGLGYGSGSALGGGDALVLQVGGTVHADIGNSNFYLPGTKLVVVSDPGGTEELRVSGKGRFTDGSLFKTGAAGTFDHYLRVECSEAVADRGGLLINNVAIGGESAANYSIKHTATFTGDALNRRYRIGWVQNSVTETFLHGGAAGSVGIAADGTVSILGVPPGTIAGEALGVTGNARFGIGAGNIDVFISGPAAQTRGLNFATAGTNRWGIYATETAETGADAGSNFRIRARTDAGVFLDDPITIVRAATGAIALGAVGNRPVVIGADPGGTDLLRVGGTSRLNTRTGVGGASVVTTMLQVLGDATTTGVNQYGIDVGFTGPSSATTAIFALRAQAATAAAAFTATSVAGLKVLGGAKGAGSTITTLYGLWIDDQTVGATNFAIKTGLGPVQFGDALTVVPPTGAVGLTITQQASMTVDGIVISAGSLTAAVAKSLLNLAQTWNTTGAPLAILVNITNTASGAAARLVSLQVAGTTKFDVDVTGLTKFNMGGAAALARACGTDLVDNTTTNSPAGSPANLKSYTLLANALDVAGKAIVIRAWGTSANNANAKAVRISFGGTQIISVTLQVSVVDKWYIEAWVYRTGAATEDMVAWGLTNGTAAKVVNFATAAVSLTANATVQCDCTQTAAADVIQEGLEIEYVS
jgi:hypothetical protein